MGCRLFPLIKEARAFSRIMDYHLFGWSVAGGAEGMPGFIGIAHGFSLCPLFHDFLLACLVFSEPGVSFSRPEWAAFLLHLLPPLLDLGKRLIEAFSLGLPAGNRLNP